MSKKYFARLSESTAKKRKTFWKKLGTYPFTKDEYDRAKEVPGDSMETKPSKYNKKYKMLFGEEKRRSITALKKKSKASGIPYSILKRVYNRGMAAWVTGHRPGAKQSAWAFARVNSFLTKGTTWYGPDADLAKEARKYLKEETQSKVSYAWYWHPIEGILIQAYDPMSSLGKHDSMASKYGFEDVDEFPRGQFYVDNSSVNTYTDGPFTSITTYTWAGKEYKDKMPKDIYKLIRKKLKIPSSYKHYSNDTKKWIEEAHIFDYTDWGWIAPDGKSFNPLETDGTHTAILRRLAENPKLTRYGLSQKETEYSATGKGWVRWLLDNNELRFNTTNWNTSIPVQRAILDIVNKYLSAREFSFEWADKDRIGNNLYRRIEVQNSGDFILKLSGERRKRLMSEDQDYEIEMISGQLKKIIDLSTDTLNIIQNQTEIPAWIQDKISVSTHNAEAIFDYYHYSEEKIQEETTKDPKIIVVYGGGFQPFHNGHMSSYLQAKEYFKQFGSNVDFYVAASNVTSERPFTFIDKKFLATEAGVKDTFIQIGELKIPKLENGKPKLNKKGEVVNIPNTPLNPLEILTKYDPTVDILVIVRSKKPGDEMKTTETSYFQQFPGSTDLSKLKSFATNAYIYQTDVKEFYVNGVKIDSGSTIRKMYTDAKDNDEKMKILKDLYPSSKKLDEIKTIFDRTLGSKLEESEEITEDKFTYLKSGYIDPKGKELIGNHNDIAIKNGFMNRKQPILKNWIRFFITTDGEAAYEFNDIKKSLGYIKKHIEDNLYLINKLYLDGKISSRFSEEKLQKWFDYKKRKTQESVEIISETIRCSKKTGKKICFVFSEKGKKMGGPYSETKAKKRLRQIEFFKHLNK